MKRLLSLLASMGLIATAGIGVVACSTTSKMVEDVKVDGNKVTFTAKSLIMADNYDSINLVNAHYSVFDKNNNHIVDAQLTSLDKQTTFKKDHAYDFSVSFTIPENNNDSKFYLGVMGKDSKMGKTLASIKVKNEMPKTNADIVLSGDFRNPDKPNDDPSHPNEPAYVSATKMIDALSDSKANDMFNALYAGKDLGGKTAKQYLEDTVGKVTSYAAFTGMKITKDNVTATPVQIITDQPDATWIASNAIIPDGLTYQIGFYAGDIDAAGQGNHYWVNMRFENNPITNVKGEFENGLVTATMKIKLPASTKVDASTGAISDDNLAIASDNNWQEDEKLMKSIELSDKNDSSKFNKDESDNGMVEASVKLTFNIAKADTLKAHKYNLYDSNKHIVLGSISFTGLNK